MFVPETRKEAFQVLGWQLDGFQRRFMVRRSFFTRQSERGISPP